jgi:hypothetical protein
LRILPLCFHARSSNDLPSGQGQLNTTWSWCWTGSRRRTRGCLQDTGPRCRQRSCCSAHGRSAAQLALPRPATSAVEVQPPCLQGKQAASVMAWYARRRAHSATATSSAGPDSGPCGQGFENSLGCPCVVVPLGSRLGLSPPLASRHPDVVPHPQRLHLRQGMHRDWHASRHQWQRNKPAHAAGVHAALRNIRARKLIEWRAGHAGLPGRLPSARAPHRRASLKSRVCALLFVDGSHEHSGGTQETTRRYTPSNSQRHFKVPDHERGNG